MVYIMKNYDGEIITILSYKPNVGDVIRIDETGDWYEVREVNQKDSTCIAANMVYYYIQ